MASLRPPPEIRLPRRRGWPKPALAASLLIHGLLAFGWVGGWLPVLPKRPAGIISWAPPTKGHEVVLMPYRAPEAWGRAGRGIAGNRLVQPALPGRDREVVALPKTAPDRVTPNQADTGRAAATRTPVPVGRIGPELAEGRLWVRPLPLPPKDLAKRLSKGHVELVDSAVQAIVQAYLDSIASDPAAGAARLPSWTKEIAGKTFGIDERNIYVAGLKIPAAVLALLPIQGGNIDQNRAYNHLMDLRADLQYAGRRAENLAEFKRIVHEIRERKEREREFERNQRTAPPPETPPTP